MANEKVLFSQDWLNVNENKIQELYEDILFYTDFNDSILFDVNNFFKDREVTYIKNGTELRTFLSQFDSISFIQNNSTLYIDVRLNEVYYRFEIKKIINKRLYNFLNSKVILRSIDKTNIF